jgi:hypothetical protein
MGSGTTAKMAIINNRNFIGAELSNTYCQIAEERIKAGALHYSLQQKHGGSTSSEVSPKLQQEAATSPC